MNDETAAGASDSGTYRQGILQVHVRIQFVGEREQSVLLQQVIVVKFSLDVVEDAADVFHRPAPFFVNGVSLDRREESVHVKERGRIVLIGIS